MSQSLVADSGGSDVAAIDDEAPGSTASTGGAGTPATGAVDTT
jgi:hypothetical protein